MKTMCQMPVVLVLVRLRMIASLLHLQQTSLVTSTLASHVASRHWAHQPTSDVSAKEDQLLEHSKPSIIFDRKTVIPPLLLGGGGFAPVTSIITAATEQSCRSRQRNILDSRDGGSSSRRRDQRNDLLQKEASILLSLAESVRELTDCQQQKVIQSAMDRDHERRMEEQSQWSEVYCYDAANVLSNDNLNCWTRHISIEDSMLNWIQIMIRVRIGSQISMWTSGSCCKKRFMRWARVAILFYGRYHDLCFVTPCCFCDCKQCNCICQICPIQARVLWRLSSFLDTTRILIQLRLLKQ